MTDKPSTDVPVEGFRAAIALVTLRLNAGTDKSKLTEYMRYLERELDGFGPTIVATGLVNLAASLVTVVADVAGIDRDAVLPMVADAERDITDEGR